MYLPTNMYLLFKQFLRRGDITSLSHTPLRQPTQSFIFINWYQYIEEVIFALGIKTLRRYNKSLLFLLPY